MTPKKPPKQVNPPPKEPADEQPQNEDDLPVVSASQCESFDPSSKKETDIDVTGSTVDDDLSDL